MRSLRTSLDLPLLLFVLSGLVGVWASYDPATSWFKFGMLLVAAALYYAVVFLRHAPQLLETFVWLFLIVNAGLAIYFVTQHDYADDASKFGVITSLGIALHKLAPQLGWHTPDPNIAAGVLELALPLGIAVVSDKWSVISKRPLFTLHYSLPTVLVAFGLLMTSSRGAWLALAIVGVAAMFLACARDALRRYALPLAAIAALLVLIAVMWLGNSFLPALESLLGTIPAGNTWVSRVTLYQQAWGLVQDYIFTGAGLGVFPMVYSTYALMIDVPFLTHAHNLFLEIWIEQGLLGFVAFCWLVVAFYLWLARHANALTWLGWAGVAAASVMLLHATVDVLLYSSRGLPLMFVPFGIAVASRQSLRDASQSPADIGRRSESSVRSPHLGFGIWAFGFVVFCFLFSSFVFHLSSFQAVWYANLGSVAQTKVELGQYHWPDRLVGDFRKNCQSQSSTCPLLSAAGYFHTALALDPGNVTASWRLRVLSLAKTGALVES